MCVGLHYWKEVTTVTKTWWSRFWFFARLLLLLLSKGSGHTSHDWSLLSRARWNVIALSRGDFTSLCAVSLCNNSVETSLLVKMDLRVLSLFLAVANACASSGRSIPTSDLQLHIEGLFKYPGWIQLTGDVSVKIAHVRETNSCSCYAQNLKFLFCKCQTPQLRIEYQEPVNFCNMNLTSVFR